MKLEIPLGRATAGTRKLTARQIVLLLVAGLLSTIAGYTGFQRFAVSAQPIAAPQTIPARIGSLVSTVTANGSVVATHLAKLSFGADGKLVELNVSVGSSVKAGQSLARQDTAPLQSKLVSTESSLKIARFNLERLKAGATPEELEAAQLAYDLAEAKYRETVAGPSEADLEAARSAVSQAASSLAAAQAKLDDLKAGPTEVDLQSAQATVDSARAGLASAQAKLDQLRAGPTAADLATAEAAVETARSNLTTAQDKLDKLKAGPTAAELAAAQAAVEQAKGSLISAEDRYQMVQDGNLAEAGGTSNSAVEQAYNTAKANYDSAVQKLQELQAGPTAAELQSAQSAVTSAQAAHDSAVAKLADLKKGPTATDLASAESAVQQARATLASAEVKLAELVAGPKEVDLASAQSSVEQARATLAGAETKLKELEGGPKESDLLSARSSLASAKVQLDSKTTVKESDLIQAEEQVRQAEAAFEQAKLDLESATMTAPFDGIVSAVAANVGEQVASKTAVVTLVDPKAFRIDVTVDETDVVKLAVGQAAAITFDALPNQRLQGKVISVAPSGTSQQGVVSYPVSIAVESPDRSFPAGMSATVSIETDRRDGALLVPNRAVRTQGRNRVVDVMIGEKTETRTVQVGASDDQFTQILSGLKEGEQVVIPITTTRNPTQGGMGGIGGPVPAGGVIIRR